MDKTTRIILILSLLVILALCGKEFVTYSTYNSATVDIENGSYEDAIVKFEIGNSVYLDRDSFLRDAKYKSTFNLYKNTLPLYAYSLAQIEYKERNMESTNSYLKLISADYSGEFCEEIKAFKESFDLEYEEYLAEKERLEKEEEAEKRKEEAEKRKKEAERIKKIVPYVGMSEYYIAKTILGNNFELIHSFKMVDGLRENVNVYRFKKGTTIIFYARCMRGQVISVNDYRDDPWETEGYTFSWSSEETDDDAPYNAKDYYDPEDFYEDNYDDFWDYEEAEDYYYEHCD